MSYILDALQKSEQDRQNQQTPSLTNQYDTQALTPLKKPKLMWWLVALLTLSLVVLVTAFVIWFLQPNQKAAYTAPATTNIASAPVVDAAAPTTANTVPASVSPPASPPPAAAQGAEPLDPRIAELYSNPPAVEPEFVYADETEYQLTADDTPKALPAKPAVKPAPPPAAAPKPVAKQAPAPATTATITQPTVATGTIARAPIVAPPAVEQETATTVASDKTGGIVEGGFMSIEQLPDTVKSEIPAIRYVAHVYSGENKAGFAILNDQKLQAGEKLADELYLEKVDKDHIIMSYRGYFFRLSAMENWPGF